MARPIHKIITFPVSCFHSGSDRRKFELNRSVLELYLGHLLWRHAPADRLFTVEVIALSLRMSDDP